MVSIFQTGYDNIDFKAATEKGVIVSNVPEYAFDSVAEMVFALALNLIEKCMLLTADFGREVLTGETMLGNQLMEKTMGVIGTCSIGTRVIQIAHGFNMNVISVTGHPGE
jgi:lactate dehydrogenase-like 2-hydroxyacid dehydrogenase